MYKIITLCHSLSGDSFRGVHLFIRSLLKTFSNYKFAEIHILHGPEIHRNQFPLDAPIFMHRMEEKEPSVAMRWYMAELPFHSEDFVMHVDLRDAYFQSFPFDFLENSPSKLHVFAENSSLHADTERINGTWQSKLHSAGIPDYLKGKPVLCFGVIGAGRWRLFQNHMRQIIRRLLTRDYFYGMDQAVHTSLVHQYPENYIVNSNEDGPVIHLHFQPPEVNENLIIRSPKGIVPAVVHQYDRYPKLEKALFQKYGIETS